MRFAGGEGGDPVPFFLSGLRCDLSFDGLAVSPSTTNYTSSTYSIKAADFDSLSCNVSASLSVCHVRSLHLLRQSFQ